MIVMEVGKRSMIVLGNKEHIITGFEIWWQFPLGLVPTLEAANEMFKDDGTPFLEIWRAVPVAVSRKGDLLNAYEAMP